MTSDAQRIMLFSLFSKLAIARGWIGQVQREIEREKLTRECLGLGSDADAEETPSWSALENAEIDLLKRRMIALREGDSLDAQLADVMARDDGERRRLIYRIEQDAKRAGFGDAYMNTIVRDMEDAGADWRALPLPALENLRDTVANRARRKAFARKSAALREAGAPAEADIPF